MSSLLFIFRRYFKWEDISGIIFCLKITTEDLETNLSGKANGNNKATLADQGEHCRQSLLLNLAQELGSYVHFIAFIADTYLNSV
jgi:hypothetical protein